MKIILSKDVDKIGKEGELVEVKDGYARNYLIPKGMAVEATKGKLKALKVEKEKEDKKNEKLKEDAERHVDKLNGQNVVVGVKVGEGGKLYGSVTNKDIAEAIEDSTGVQVDRRKIEIEEPIKGTGEYRVSVRLYTDINAEIFLSVEEK